MNRHRTRWLCLFALVLGLNAMPLAVAQEEEGEEERLLKVAFLYNFAQFTRWPEGALAEDNPSLNLCTVGQDVLAADLQLLGGKVIKGHLLVVHQVTAARIYGRCHLLYVAASEHEHYGNLVNDNPGDALLTVSELPGFARAGGIIELYREEGRIRFIINLAAARMAGLEISSRLLRLATVIGEGDKP